MKRIATKLNLLFATVVVSSMLILPAANASLLLEPYLGYHLGSWSQGGTSNNMNGVSYGGRVGLQHLGLMGGIDFMGGNWTDKASPSNTVTPSDLGVFVGFNFPVMIRVYGMYGFNSALKFENSGTSDTYKGSDLKLGLGFTALPFVSINLEYITGTYTKHNAGTLTNNLTDSMFGLTVSLPLVLL